MQYAWLHLFCMTMIQIRNVPEKIHRKIKSTAAMEGLSLSAYLLREISRHAERPSFNAIRERLESRESIQVKESTDTALNAERAKRC